MPRAFRSLRSKSFRRENVSVPNADGASGVGIRGGQRRSPLGVKGGGRGRFARCRLILRQRRKRRYRQTAAWGHNRKLTFRAPPRLSKQRSMWSLQCPTNLSVPQRTGSISDCSLCTQLWSRKKLVKPLEWRPTLPIASALPEELQRARLFLEPMLTRDGDIAPNTSSQINGLRLKYRG